jgi:hypothetical protein
MAKAKKSRGSGRRRVSLAGFFRRLWGNHSLMARFSESREGRDEVLDRFQLSARHRKMLAEGCMRDIIRELAGVKKEAKESNTVVNCTDEVECGHPECAAFMKAVRKKE